MEQITKKCFKCGQVFPLSEFYKHPQTADGHLNKCKTCTKNDAVKHYSVKSKDEEWFKRERERGREKYHRLGYKNKEYNHKTRNLNKEEGSTSVKLRARGIDTKGLEAHHWNYNKPNSVILLSPKAHHRLHKFMVVNYEDKFCYTLDGIRLDTEDKAIDYFSKVLSQYDDLSETIKIINY